MRREIKLIILVFALVVGPAIALSFLAVRVLESWQLVLQKRMAGEAGHVLDEAVAAWNHELTALRAMPDFPANHTKPSNMWVAHASELSLQHSWLDGLFVTRGGAEMVYPPVEPIAPPIERDVTSAEQAGPLSQVGAYLEQGDMAATIKCLELVAENRSPESGVGTRNAKNERGQRDSDEGFRYDLIALKRLATIYELQGQTAKVSEIRLKVLEEMLRRYDELVPLQRESMIEWLECAGLQGGEASGLQSQWRERMRLRTMKPDERTRVGNGIRMMESTIPDSGWLTMRVQEADFLVTKLPQPGTTSLVLALQFDEHKLIEHLNALFAIAVSNTEIRVRCQIRDEGEAGPILAVRQLPTPFEAMSLVATPEDVPAFVANARLQARLYRGGGLLLLISVVAGIWLVWREAAREIQQAGERSAFAAAVSHDLRTPLSSMRMLAESLYMGNVTDTNKQKKFLGTIIKESDRLSRLTDRALYFIRYGQGALRYQFTEGDLGGVVRETVETFAVGASGEVKIGIDIPSQLPSVKFDAGAIEQVVYNLLDNAVKYSRKEGEERGVPSSEPRGAGDDGLINVKLFVEGGQVVLSVEDHGVGMTPEEVRQVLKPYARGKNAGRQNARGLGLGLALCQHIVQAHGGSIQIQSEPGKGSKFKIILPG
ncbi:MAG: HAMP domain-containing sensor histidine kinase [bacterium]|jgi:signal transduction histidine kinase